MADSSTNYPPPSPAPTLPTPHAPGFFPETPAEGAYRHDEGPLDAAGRALPRDTTGDKGTLGGALLGVGVGALFGGPLGALVGGSVGGIAGLEEQGLRSKFGHSPAGQQKVTEERTATALQQSPAQRLVGNDGDGSVSALLAGGAGAHVVDRELDEPAAEQVPPATLSGLPVAEESIVDMSPTTPSAFTPAEEKPNDGFTGIQKAGLGAGAGLAAGGLAGAALASHNDDHDNAVSKFDSPYTPGVDSTPGPPLSTNPAIVGESTVTPTPFTQEQPTHTSTTTTNVIHNPEYTPAPTVTSHADETVANDSPTKLETAAPYAGAAALAGAGAATALPREDLEQTDRLDDSTNRNVEEPVVAQDEPSRLEKAAPYAGAAALGAGAATALPRQDTQEVNRLDDQKINDTVPRDSHFEKSEKATPLAGAATTSHAAHPRETAEDVEERARLDNSLNKDVPGVTDEAVDGKRKGAEMAAGAALGAVGGATAVEAVEKAGGGHEDVEFPAKEDPAAALAAQLAGKDSIPAQSRFYESLDGAPSPAAGRPIPPHLTSRFSDATVDTIATNATDDTIDGAHGGFEDQRAVAPVPLFRQGSYLAEEGQATPTKNHKIDTDALAATTAASTVPGFAHPDQTSSAFQDFAHLSQPETASSTSAISPVVGGANVDAPRDIEEDDRKDGHHKGALAAGALGGGAVGGGLAAAYAAEHENERTPPASMSTPSGNDSQLGTAAGLGAGAGAGAGAAALPHSPKHLNLRDQLGEGSEYSPSTPSSTRAMAGSPTRTGATTPASFTQQGEYTPPMREQAAFLSTAESPNQGDYYAGNKDHESTLSSQTPRQQPAGAGVVAESTRQQPQEQSSHDAQQEYQQQQVHPVERSPHMKIATRKDSIGHNRLHKKSLGDPSQQQRSPVLAGAGAGALGEHGGAQSPARTASPHGSGSPRTEGEGIWNGAVANVVNDETVQRGGHRPGLVTIDSENRRDNVMDRMVGVSDPTHSTKNSPASTHSRNQSSASQHGGEHIPPPTAGSTSSTPRKLTRSRRSSSVNQPNPNPAFGPDGFRLATDEGEPAPKKEGFVSKLFGGHKRSASKNSSSVGEGAGSPRASLDGRRSGEVTRQ